MKPSSTPPSIIFIVVCTMASLAIIFGLTLSACVILQVDTQHDFYTLANGVIMGLLGMLVSTRTAPKDDSSSTSATVTVTQTPTPPPPPADIEIPVTPPTPTPPTP